MTTPTIAERAFDCVDFKRRAQVEIYEQIQGMTHEQERAYFKQQAEQGPLGEWWKRIKAVHRP
jgi:hypothetical protein